MHFDTFHYCILRDVIYLSLTFYLINVHIIKMNFLIANKLNISLNKLRCPLFFYYLQAKKDIDK
jgi:hypothetical protein